MVHSEPLRTHEAVRGYVEQICFKTGPPGLVGAELEWLVISPAHPRDPVLVEHLRAALQAAGPFPGGSTLTFEPGGQLELSSPPALGPSACWHRLEADVRHLHHALGASGLAITPAAIDPFRSPHRQVDEPRYDAMEIYFDRRGPSGRIMMCSTAAIQVNLDAGQDAADVARRWQFLHAAGPALVAAFANSPVHAGQVTGWKSTRQAVWQQLDAARTEPPPGWNPVLAWADYALDAPVMLLRTSEHRWTADPGFTFGSWVGQPDGGAPTQADLDYHLSTLFPPVRPRGWFEVRYLDTLPPRWWSVPVAVLSALVDVPGAAETVLTTLEPVAGAWSRAARYALEPPELAAAARACFDAALQALPELQTEQQLVDIVEEYADRYVSRGRSPADDALMALHHAEDEEFA